MIWKVVTLLGVVLCALGDEHHGHHHAISEQKVVVSHGHHGELAHIGPHEPEHHEEYAWTYPSYEFSYKVEDPHTHDFKGQHEHRHGDEVKGLYWLIQPDGHKRTVKYHADKHSGFHAHVEYEKVHHEVHPDHISHHVPHVVHVEHVAEHHEPAVEEPKPVVEKIVEEVIEEHAPPAEPEPVEVEQAEEKEPEHHAPKHHHKKVIEYYQEVRHPLYKHKLEHRQEHHEHNPVIEHKEVLEHKEVHEHKQVHDQIRHERRRAHYDHKPIEHKSAYGERKPHHASHDHHGIHEHEREEKHEDESHRAPRHPEHIPLLDLHKPQVRQPYYGHRRRQYRHQQ